MGGIQHSFNISREGPDLDLLAKVILVRQQCPIPQKRSSCLKILVSVTQRAVKAQHERPLHLREEIQETLLHLSLGSLPPSLLNLKP